MLYAIVGAVIVELHLTPVVCVESAVRIVLLAPTGRVAKVPEPVPAMVSPLAVKFAEDRPTTPVTEVSSHSTPWFAGAVFPTARPCTPI
jgi:hypothetical protein